VRHEFQFTFDVPFIKAALRRDVIWKGYVAAGLILAIGVALRWWVGHWVLWATAFMLLCAIFVVWRFYFALDSIGKRVHELWIKQAPDRVIRYQLDDDGFDIVMQNARTHYDWKGLRRLWCYHDAWLIEIVRMQSVFFPPEGVSEEIRDYIVERCRASGVRV